MLKTKILLAAGLLLGGCTEPGQTTAVGAAAGGAVGAGLGAIIGNQTGDAGSGLAIGAIAGAGAGGAMGNALEAQEKTLRAQDEALERQERMIAAQRTELDELRKLSQDSVSYKGSPASSIAGAQTKTPMYTAGPSARGSYKWGENPSPEADSAPPPAQRQVPAAQDPADCVQAEDEVRTARTKPALPDKLFHYRRALRLCPDNAAFHNGLGEVYAALQRREDAEYEFREALRLDPTLAAAEQNLKSLLR